MKPKRLDTAAVTRRVIQIRIRLIVGKRAG